MSNPIEPPKAQNPGYYAPFDPDPSAYNLSIAADATIHSLAAARDQLSDEGQDTFDDLLLRRARAMRFGVYEAIEEMEDRDEDDGQ